MSSSSSNTHLAQISGLLEVLQGLLKCRKCKLVFNEAARQPHLLPCGHNVCEQCLISNYQGSAQGQKNQKIKCDKCDKTSQVKINKIYKNLDFLEIVQKANLIQELEGINNTSIQQKEVERQQKEVQENQVLYNEDEIQQQLDCINSEETLIVVFTKDKNFNLQENLKYLENEMQLKINSDFKRNQNTNQMMFQIQKTRVLEMFKILSRFSKLTAQITQTNFNTVVVQNLPTDAKEQEVKEILEKVGSVQEFHLYKHQTKKILKVYAHAFYSNKEEAKLADVRLNKYMLRNNQLAVKQD